MSVESARRYYLLKRRAALTTQDVSLASAWHRKQLDEPGVVLASDFPHRARLEAQGYFAREDLLGATVEELQQVGFSKREAAAVLAAL